MEIITQIEKAAIQLERAGKRDKASDLRHTTTNILLNAKQPESNLTKQQKKGLSFFKRNPDIAVTPFDKGQGFVTIQKNELIKKAEAEFKNTEFDTANKTSSYEGKIQRKLRNLKDNGKISDYLGRSSAKNRNLYNF